MTKTRPAKSNRIYANEEVKAATHPTRQVILDSLQEADRSTVDLEALTGENRYNLYHHLAILEQAGLVGFRIAEGRAKQFYLLREAAPKRSFYSIARERLGAREFRRLLKQLEPALDGGIAHPSRVARLDIMVSYDED